MNKVTGTIITLNNEKIIEDCIISLKSLCDEIIVVDSLSTDQTVKVAKGLGATSFTVKKLECLKQAYALNTLAWNNKIGLWPILLVCKPE